MKVIKPACVACSTVSEILNLDVQEIFRLSFSGSCSQIRRENETREHNQDSGSGYRSVI